MTTRTIRCLTVAVAGAAILGIAGCEQEGPAEKAGKQIDQAMEESAESLEEATDEVGGKLEEAGDELRDRADQ
ncbi:MAG: hypothetical protein PVF91_03775 [Chromatiales bacterium]|jgi:hyperosmotically inducible protein